MTLSEYVLSGVARHETRNGQAWFLSGGLSTDGFTSSEIIARARENIQNHFLVVGLTEHFDESLILMKRRLGWRKLPFYYRRHVASNRPPSSEVSLETKELIKDHNRLDLQLYKEAQAAFERDVAAMGRSFAIEVRLFRLLNRWYQRYVGLRSWAGDISRSLRRKIGGRGV
jgi:hypothetical protein